MHVWWYILRWWVVFSISEPDELDVSWKSKVVQSVREWSTRYHGLCGKSTISFMSTNSSNLYGWPSSYTTPSHYTTYYLRPCLLLCMREAYSVLMHITSMKWNSPLCMQLYHTHLENSFCTDCATQVDGQVTDRPALIVGVIKKKSPDQLAPGDEMLPEKVHDMKSGMCRAIRTSPVWPAMAGPLFGVLFPFS